MDPKARGSKRSAGGLCACPHLKGVQGGVPGESLRILVGKIGVHLLGKKKSGNHQKTPQELQEMLGKKTSSSNVSKIGKVSTLGTCFFFGGKKTPTLK